MKLTRLQQLAEGNAPAEKPRTRNFNEMLRTAKSVKLDLRGGNVKLDPNLEIKLKDGTIVYIAANPNGKSIGWTYESEAGADAP